MKRTSRTLAAVLAGTIGTTGLLLALPTPASADVLGQVTVSPTSGIDSTGFGGSATTACPAGTDSSFWSLEGGALTPYSAYLGDGLNNGVGAQSFAGASVANIETAVGALADGTYQVVFHCFTGPAETDSYRANFTYAAAGAGSWSVSPATLTPISTSTALSATPAGPVEEGTVVTLDAVVAPASGTAPSTGSVEFFDGATSLGIDNTVVAGAASLPWTTAGVASHSLTAVFTPAAPTGPTDRGFATSTSPATTVSVTTVAPRSTTSALAASPVAGDAYQAVTLTCDVTASSGTAAGNASFKDGATLLATVPLTAGSAQVTTNSLGAGAHSLVCEFVGNAPYTNSTSNTVAASYTQAGASHQQNVIVTIPVGVITITTPYTPSNPLDLGTAVLDQLDSTYSASAALSGIVVTDTRSGNLGWTAQVIAGPFGNGTSTFPGAHAGLTGVTAVQVAGNALLASNVVEADTTAFAPGLGTPRTFATYAAGQTTGSVQIDGVFGIDAVPTSITPGVYTSLVTFTAV
jgi:hypothetical protein